jgi:competence protein ComEA
MTLQRAEQWSLGLLAGLGIVVLLGYVIYHSLPNRRLIEFDSAPSNSADFSIDLNQANWVEISLLPGIGEVLAKEIVAHREKKGEFRTIDELSSVPGIGPARLSQIRPYIRAITEVTDSNETTPIPPMSEINRSE